MMAISKTDGAKAVTLRECSEKRATARYWIGGIATAVVAVSAAYVVPAVSIGYSAMHRIDTHEARQNGTLKTIEHQLSDLQSGIDKVDEKQTVQQEMIIRLLSESGPSD